MKRLRADTVNGITVTDEPVTMHGEDIFYASLKDLEAGEVMVCGVSDEMARKIDEEYGIHA